MKVITKRFPPKVMRGCIGQARHASKGKAEAAARALKKLNERESYRATEIGIYFCVRCHTWHIGHSACLNG